MSARILAYFLYDSTLGVYVERRLTNFDSDFGRTEIFVLHRESKMTRDSDLSKANVSDTDCIVETQKEAPSNLGAEPWKEAGSGTLYTGQWMSWSEIILVRHADCCGFARVLGKVR